MKRLLLIPFVLVVFSLKSQPRCNNIQFLTDLAHYNVLPAGDSSFVKYIQFDLSDTVGVSKITYTLTDVTSGTQLQQQQYSLLVQLLQNLTVTNNCTRAGKNVKISLGYLSYLNKN